MGFINAEMRLCDVITNEPSLIPVINRFGIKLGVGDKSIRNICAEKEIDSEYFLSILNTFINADYFPENKFKSFDAIQLIDFLTRTNQSCEAFLLPNIEHHLNSFIERSDPNNTNLELLRKFFAVFKNEFKARIKLDQGELFPAFKKLFNEASDAIITIDSKNVDADPVEEKLIDFKNLMIQHLSGEYDENLCYAVLVAVCNLEKEINRHNRIRNKILFPMVKALSFEKE